VGRVTWSVVPDASSQALQLLFPFLLLFSQEKVLPPLPSCLSSHIHTGSQSSSLMTQDNNLCFQVHGRSWYKGNQRKEGEGDILQKYMKAIDLFVRWGEM
jgi:hypothetical protein